jgi:hypothetical protein
MEPERTGEPRRARVGREGLLAAVIDVIYKVSKPGPLPVAMSVAPHELSLEEFPSTRVDKMKWRRDDLAVHR